MKSLNPNEELTTRAPQPLKLPRGGAFGAEPERSLRTETFETLLKNAPVGVFVVDQELRIYLINPVARPAFGKIPKLIGRSFDEVMQVMWTKEYAAELVRIFRHTLQTGESHDMAERMEYRADRGVTEYYDWRIGRLILPEGKYGVICYFRDITDRKRAQEALRLNQERLTAALDTARMTCWEWNPKADHVTASANVTEVFGLLAGGVMEKIADRFHLLHPDDLEQHRALVLRAGTNGDGWHTEFRIIRPRDGQIAWLEERAMASRDPRSDEVQLTGLVWDISERKATEAALRESEERFRTVANLGPDLLWSNDPAGYTTWYNQSWLEFTGQTLDQAIGYGWLDAIHPDDRPESRRHFQSAVDSGADLQHEHRIRRADGRYLWFLIRAKPLRDENSRILGWFGSATNVDEFKRTQDALSKSRAELQAALEEAEAARCEAEEANGTKDQFLAMLSHELRTPLTPVLMTADSLLRRKDLADRVRNGLQTICRNIDIETRLIDDLLNVTRIVRGKFEINPQQVNLHELLTATLQICEPDLRGKEQVLMLELSAQATHVHGDPARLQQVFWNLLKNASKFSPRGAAIRVHSWNAPGLVLVSVADAGIGIDPQALPHIFDAFRQADPTITRRFGGLGLGLAIVKATMESHGGSITGESEGLGHGAKFTIRLPLVALPAPALDVQ